MTLDTLTFCIALAVGVVATGVVDATTILPPRVLHWLHDRDNPRRSETGTLGRRVLDRGLIAGARVLARIGRGL